MTCNESRARVGALVDRELDLVRSLEVEAHVAACAGCARALEQQKQEEVRRIGTEVGAVYLPGAQTGAHDLGFQSFAAATSKVAAAESSALQVRFNSERFAWHPKRRSGLGTRSFSLTACHSRPTRTRN